MPKYDVISPDGFSTRQDGYCDTLEAAFDELVRFCKTYIKQGYYSGPGYRIPVEVLHGECGIKTISDEQLADEAADEAEDDEDDNEAEGEIQRIEGSMP